MRPGRGRRIEFARWLLGWSQTQLGDAIGVGQGTVSEWESQDERRINRSNLKAMAEALGTTPEWITDGEVPRPPRAGELGAYISVKGRIMEAAGLLSGVLAELSATPTPTAASGEPARVVEVLETMLEKVPAPGAKKSRKGRKKRA
jgi:transcriptional regulator with XRE-family HTH domain